MRLLEEEKSKNFTGTSYKHPIFDGENPNEFKDWWDIVYATLEMEDIEEYVGKDFATMDIPTKDECEADETDSAEIQKLAKEMKIVRKEMKKATAHMVRVTKDFPKRLVMEANTPYEAYVALKTKYSVAKNREDFTKLDKEWNEFKVTDERVDPDKVIATLEEHSEKLGEFGDRYKKDAL